MLSALFFAAAIGGSWISESNFQLYVPDGYTKREKRPLVVAIHGCTQTADDFAGLARVARLADRERVLVLLPNQDPAANAMRCWNWFVPENQKRGAGEPAAIKAMIDWVEARYAVDRGRVYVFGISSGGYMTSILLSCYSDVFAAGMVASGGMYEAAIDLQTAVPTALKGSERDPAASGRDAYRCSGSNHRTVPVLVFHGSDDPFATADRPSISSSSPTTSATTAWRTTPSSSSPATPALSRAATPSPGSTTAPARPRSCATTSSRAWDTPGPAATPRSRGRTRKARTRRRSCGTSSNSSGGASDLVH
jgi:poly(hydroxyalkanoate) depolymerase family esterase